jgi:hypothetical protein
VLGDALNGVGDRGMRDTEAAIAVSPRARDREREEDDELAGGLGRGNCALTARSASTW